MASDKSDFSYKIRHCTHPTDTNGYRFLLFFLSLFPYPRPLSLSLFPSPLPSPSVSRLFFFHLPLLTGLMCSRLSSCNRQDLPGIIVCGRVDRSMQIKASARTRVPRL